MLHKWYFRKVNELVKKAKAEALTPDSSFYYTIKEAGRELEKQLPEEIREHVSFQNMIDNLIKLYYETCKQKNVLENEYTRIVHNETECNNEEYHALRKIERETGKDFGTSLSRELWETRPTKSLTETLGELMEKDGIKIWVEPYR
jgi:hypothetical protein